MNDPKYFKKESYIKEVERWVEYIEEYEEEESKSVETDSEIIKYGKYLGRGLVNLVSASGITTNTALIVLDLGVKLLKIKYWP
jgi:hypothetical protein